MCRHFGETSSKVEATFTQTGFTNFKKGPEKFRKHESTEVHKTAKLEYVNRLINAQNKTSVRSQVDSHHNARVRENRSYLSIIFSIIMWLCGQGLPLRGHFESEASKNRGSY